MYLWEEDDDGQNRPIQSEFFVRRLVSGTFFHSSVTDPPFSIKEGITDSTVSLYLPLESTTAGGNHLQYGLYLYLSLPHQKETPTLASWVSQGAGWEVSLAQQHSLSLALQSSHCLVRTRGSRKCREQYRPIRYQPLGNVRLYIYACPSDCVLIHSYAKLLILASAKSAKESCKFVIVKSSHCIHVNYSKVLSEDE